LNSSGGLIFREEKDLKGRDEAVIRLEKLVSWGRFIVVQTKDDDDPAETGRPSRVLNCDTKPII